MANGNTCIDHSGCVARIENVEKSTGEQWKKISELDKRIDSIMTRINIMLTGIVISCVLLAINLAIKII